MFDAVTVAAVMIIFEAIFSIWLMLENKSLTKEVPGYSAITK
jgi:hypothetical protein